MSIKREKEGGAGASSWGNRGCPVGVSDRQPEGMRAEAAHLSGRVGEEVEEGLGLWRGVCCSCACFFLGPVIVLVVAGVVGDGRWVVVLEVVGGMVAGVGVAGVVVVVDAAVVVVIT